MFPEALKRARFLDKWLSENGRPLGPLHGLPISVKVRSMIAGVDSADLVSG